MGVAVGMMRKSNALALLAALALAACSEREERAAYDNTAERLAFEERHNRELLATLRQRRDALESELAETDPAAAGREELERELGALLRRLERPLFFERLEESDLPAGLVWETGLDQPEIGSPEAVKGGTLHSYFAGFAYPPTIRSIGKEANNSFRSQHWDDVELAQVGLHPETGGIIPGLADRWAVAEDGQSVYFHIDDEARWSDGSEVTSEDWMMAGYIYLSPYLTEPFYRTYVTEQFWGIAAYGDDYVCVRNANPKPLAPYFAAMPPYQAAFYREFGPDFEDRYNWRVRPTTGAYRIREEDIVKGRSISLTRVEDWWARDRKYYRHRFNPDRMEYRLYRDPEKVFQLFLRGEIDLFLLGEPKKWYEETEVDPVFKGYIERVVFHNEYPRPNRGLYFNFSRPLLDDRDIRIGLNHATHWQKVIDIDLRGDAERLNLQGEGFGELSNPEIEAREFSVAAAREAFARAGFDRAGPDGILRDERGRRLSFTVSYPRHPLLDAMLLRLKEEARRAGVEYQLEGMDATAFFQKTSKKEHEMAFAAWSLAPPFNDYYQYFHSSEAHEPGTTKPRPMTNNVTVFADPGLDGILEENRNARSMEVVRDTAYEIERVLHDQAVWIPGYKSTSYRLGYWRWVRWPDEFNVRLASEPEMSHVLWIDTARKTETYEAMREGVSFPEVNRVYDRYRHAAPGEAEEAGEAGEPPVESTAEDAAPGAGEAEQTEPDREEGEGGEP